MKKFVLLFENSDEAEKEKKRCCERCGKDISAYAGPESSVYTCPVGYGCGTKGFKFFQEEEE